MILFFRWDNQNKDVQRLVHQSDDGWNAVGDETDYRLLQVGKWENAAQIAKQERKVFLIEALEAMKT